MEQPFRMEIVNERRTQRHRLLELKIHSPGAEDPFYAVASFYASEMYFNLPASPEANGFVQWLNGHIGEPSEPPIVKCSARWNESMVGPMQTVKWVLEAEKIHRFDLLLQ